MKRLKTGFTLIELLVVVCIIVIIISILIGVFIKVKRIAEVTRESATIKNKLDDAILRGAVKEKDYQFYRDQLKRQIDTSIGIKKLDKP